MHCLPIKRDDRAPTDEDIEAGLDILHDAALVRRQRQCLMCRSQFSSEWSGERICPKCRGGSAWRQGLGVRGRCVPGVRRAAMPQALGAM